jgi:hypothetical protein
MAPIVFLIGRLDPLQFGGANASTLFSLLQPPFLINSESTVWADYLLFDEFLHEISQYLPAAAQGDLCCCFVL